MDRREFMKGAALGVGAGVLGSMGLYSYSPLRRAFLPEVKRGTADIGVCKSVKVTNISETSWFDNGIFMNDVTGAGGLLVDQYTFNLGALRQRQGRGQGDVRGGPQADQAPPAAQDRRGVGHRQGKLRPCRQRGRLLLPRRDREHGRRRQPVTCSIPGGITTGWTRASSARASTSCLPTTRSTPSSRPMSTWTTTGASPWSPSTIPTSTSTRFVNTFYPAGKEYLKACGHVGKWTEVPKGLHTLQPGVALYQFDCPIIFKVFGEMSLYCNVKDVGLVSTHRLLPSGDHPLRGHGLQGACLREGSVLRPGTGGLHISPFDDWDPKNDDLVIGLKKWNLQQVGCNHCTGLITAQKFVDAGYPVVKGTARFRSKTTNSPRQRRRHQVPRLR